MSDEKPESKKPTPPPTIAAKPDWYVNSEGNLIDNNGMAIPQYIPKPPNWWQRILNAFWM